MLYTVVALLLLVLSVVVLSTPEMPVQELSSSKGRTCKDCGGETSYEGATNGNVISNTHSNALAKPSKFKPMEQPPAFPFHSNATSLKSLVQEPGPQTIARVPKVTQPQAQLGTQKEPFQGVVERLFVDSPKSTVSEIDNNLPTTTVQTVSADRPKSISITHSQSINQPPATNTVIMPSSLPTPESFSVVNPSLKPVQQRVGKPVAVQNQSNAAAATIRKSENLVILPPDVGSKPVLNLGPHANTDPDGDGDSDDTDEQPMANDYDQSNIVQSETGIQHQFITGTGSGLDPDSGLEMDPDSGTVLGNLNVINEADLLGSSATPKILVPGQLATTATSSVPFTTRRVEATVSTTTRLPLTTASIILSTASTSTMSPYTTVLPDSSTTQPITTTMGTTTASQQSTTVIIPKIQSTTMDPRTTVPPSSSTSNMVATTENITATVAPTTMITTTPVGPVISIGEAGKNSSAPTNGTKIVLEMTVKDGKPKNPTVRIGN